MADLIGALPEAGPSQTQLTILAGLTPEAAERAEEEAAEYRGLWEKQISTNSEIQKNNEGGEKRDCERIRSALDNLPTFNGDQTKFKNFIEHISLHFKEDPEYFRDEKKKKAFVLSYMKEGTGASFRSEWLEDKMSMTSALEQAQYQRWAIFERRLTEAFKNNYKEEEAQNQILQLKQGSKTARDVFLEFDSLQRRAGYRDDSILITLLKRNMNYTLVDKLYVSGLPPSRYKEWRKLLLNYDQIWRKTEKQKKGYFGQTERTGARKEDGGGKKAHSGTKDRTGTVYSGAGQPMEIDKARYRKEGLCFKCRVNIRKNTLAI
ncbi:hypothetical protein SERLA73DRAFT_75519 [Serpula lacrymans var. lacrymans S7.3]|uniref:Retrotransposon gag domain-containing protein n=2 Tax=Serpula lacrymans var. lacrymans TaxID=341189 RepID=F8Q511_SERL3|nr:uncharacterized protein SERLADRAFT_440221 [Serpula lacrymans var. lacrymans S7.9]EGN96638.1 hypothetical protein SERLA73DRAFT_75519 [Serpula lacrymans var. lacrymans S7.3]EGO22206.1 hypothetical protein SERLADRAFT_440221 [Serpula lacrymans var. lacrymans S7.9]